MIVGVATLTKAARRRREHGPYSWAPTVDDAREAAKAVAEADPRVRRVMLFGSVAEGAARPGSDIDLAVVVAVGLDGLPEAAEALYAAAEGAAARQVDLVVRTPAQWEHLVANVSSSLDRRIAAEGLVLYDNPSAPGEVDGGIGGVPGDNMDTAAVEADSVRAQINELRSSIAGIPVIEADIAADPGRDPRAEREGRYRQLSQTAHMAVERSIAAVRAAVDGGGYKSGHDLDGGLGELDPSDERDALFAAVSVARKTDGALMNWRRAAYAGHLPDYAAEAAAGRVADWVAAAVGCAEAAAAAVAARARTDQHRRSAASLASAARLLGGMGVDADTVEHGPRPGV